MARVILYGAPADVLQQGDLPAGWEAIRLEYEDGVTDVQRWLSDARDAWRASYSLDTDELRAVVLRYAGRPTAAALDIRDRLGQIAAVSGVRLVLVVPSAHLVWTQAALDTQPHPSIRTHATTPAQLSDWIAARAWPVPGNPAKGGSHRRIGGGRHVPWEHCIDDPEPRQWTPPPSEGA